jgi:hypothetical protein
MSHRKQQVVALLKAIETGVAEPLASITQTSTFSTILLPPMGLPAWLRCLGPCLQARRAWTLIEKDFPMPFVDTNDDVFLYETLPCTRIRPGHGAPSGKDCLPRCGST